VFRRAYELVMEEPVTFLVGGGILAALNVAASGLLLGPALVGISHAVLKRQRGEAVSISDVFYGFENFGQAFIAGFIYELGVGIGLLFLIVPGLVFGAIFFPMFPLLAERRISFPEAFYEARRLTLPVLVEQTLIFTLALLLAGAGLLLFVVGIVLTLPLAVVAVVLAYQEAAHPSRGEPRPA